MTGIHIHNKPSRVGFTLVETLISIGIFMILVTIAVGGFVQALHTQGEVSTLISAQGNVSLGIEEMAREIRWGFLFCHAEGSSTPDPACYCDPSGDSGVPPDRPDFPDTNPETRNLQVWTCPALDFYNSDSDHVDYWNENGALMRSDDNGVPQVLTSNDVTVKYLSFRLFGNLEGDGWTPRVTISLGIAPSSSDPAIANTVLNFETTVSARQIDCTSGGSC